MKQSFILSPIFLIIFLLGCSSKDSENKTQALFNSRIEAERAAKNFNCTGAHKMGDLWMPCATHDALEGNHMNHQH